MIVAVDADERACHALESPRAHGASGACRYREATGNDTSEGPSRAL